MIIRIPELIFYHTCDIFSTCSECCLQQSHGFIESHELEDLDPGEEDEDRRELVEELLVVSESCKVCKLFTTPLQ